jgi:hypothetical protein
MRDDSEMVETPSRRNTARQRRALWTGLAISAAFHALLLFGWRAPSPDGPGSLAAGPRAGDYRAAAGGGEMIALAIAAPRPIEVPAPPDTRPQIRDPELPVPEPERHIVTASLSGPRSGAAADGRSGQGLPGADGAGDGGTERAGRDRRTPPTPRSIVPRWDAPKELRGQRVTLRVRVDSRGEPTGEIDIQPRIADAGFEKQLRRDVLAMDFLPGRQDGRAVADWAELTLTF